MKKDIQKLVKEAEKKIADVLMQLENDTGLEVTRIGSGKDYNESNSRWFTSSASLELTFNKHDRT